MDLISTLHQLTLKLDQSWEVTLSNFPGTGHRFTRMCNNPETATLDEILYLSERLQKHPLLLYSTYGLGKETLTEREINLVKEHQELYTTLNTYQSKTYNSSNPNWSNAS